MPQHLLTPEPERTFVDGPPIDPPDALLKWLETTASTEPRPRIRLPVVVRFRDQHRLGLDGGHIGVSPAALPGVIQVTLDDTSMGIALRGLMVETGFTDVGGDVVGFFEETLDQDEAEEWTAVARGLVARGVLEAGRAEAAIAAMEDLRARGAHCGTASIFVVSGRVPGAERDGA